MLWNGERCPAAPLFGQNDMASHLALPHPPGSKEGLHRLFARDVRKCAHTLRLEHLGLRKINFDC